MGSLPELPLAGQHRRDHGGQVDTGRLRRALTGPLARAADGRPVLAVDVTCWLRPDAHTSPQRILCHAYDREGASKSLSPAGHTRSPARSSQAAARGPRRWTHFVRPMIGGGLLPLSILSAVGSLNGSPVPLMVMMAVSRAATMMGGFLMKRATEASG
ncbi:transposase (plasmid) [Streptomyces sp. NBC_01727]|nr:transposase [Streptomyces sp. NBC_01727]